MKKIGIIYGMENSFPGALVDHINARNTLLGHFFQHQSVAELRSCLRVSPDTTSVVIDIGGDEARADDGQEHHESDSPQLHLRH